MKLTEVDEGELAENYAAYHGYFEYVTAASIEDSGIYEKAYFWKKVCKYAERLTEEMMDYDEENLCYTLKPGYAERIEVNESR